MLLFLIKMNFGARFSWEYSGASILLTLVEKRNGFPMHSLTCFSGLAGKKTAIKKKQTKPKQKSPLNTQSPATEFLCKKVFHQKY